MLLLPRRFCRRQGRDGDPSSLTQFVKAGWAGRKCCSKAFSLGSKREKRFCPAITNSESGSGVVGTGGRIILWRPSLRHACNFQPSSYNALDKRIVVMIFWRGIGKDLKMKRNTNTFSFWKFSRAILSSICFVQFDGIPEIRKANNRNEVS